MTAFQATQPKDDLPQRLRALVRGFHEWRVENPQDGNYCMSMTRDDSVNPEKDCRDWLEIEKRAGGQFAGYVVKHHHVLTAKDKALAEAADALAALAAQHQRTTARAVVTTVFELCEAVEDVATPPDAKQYEQGFKAGERFAAKHIREAVGTWAWDEGITSKPQERDALTEVCDRAKAIVDREPRHSKETLYALLSKEFAEAPDEFISRAVAATLAA